jgi:hypothetical protein
MGRGVLLMVWKISLRRLVVLRCSYHQLPFLVLIFLTEYMGTGRLD